MSQHPILANTRMYLLMLVLIISYSEQSEASTYLNFLGKRRAKPTVCLNMIVKDEAHVIKRCLESTLPMIDYWVIVDTGSTDGTQKVIRDYMKEKDIPGELHEAPWVSFSHNREEALNLAKFKADYILFMDADDVLHYSNNFKLPFLTHDCYLMVAKAGTTEYTLTRLVKANLDWHWQGALHEYVTSKHAKEGAVLQGVEYIYICDGARSKDPEKVHKDVKVLMDALEKEPDNARYVFYLGQTYASGHDLENALKYYNKRAEMGGWDQEVYWSKVQAAHLMHNLGYDRESVEEAFIDALKFRPSRPECYYYLAALARENREYQKGYDIAQQGMKLQPTTDTLFSEKWTHDGLMLEFSICAAALEKYEDCIKTNQRLLEKRNLIPQFRACAMQNLEFAKERFESQKIIQAVDDAMGFNEG